MREEILQSEMSCFNVAVLNAATDTTAYSNTTAAAD
jgi:hypothetical protein